MRKRIRNLFIGLLILFVSALLLFVVLYNYTPVIDRSILRLLNVAVDHQVDIHYEDLAGNLLGKLRIRRLTIITGNDTLRCKRVEFSYNIVDFLHNRYLFNQVLLIEPRLSLRFLENLSDSSRAEEASRAMDSTLAGLDLSRYPQIKVKSLIVKDGSVALKSAAFSEVLSDIQMELYGEVTPEKIDIRPRYIRANWVSRDVQLTNLSFSLTGNSKQVTLNQLEISLNRANIVGHGEVELWPRYRMLLFADTSTVDLELLRRFVPELAYRQGFVKFYGEFIGVPGRFTGEVFLSARADSLNIYQLQAQVQQTGPSFLFENFALRTNFGKVAGEVQFSLTGKNRMNLDFSGVNLQKINILEKKTRLNGKISLSFTTWNIQKMSGVGRLSLFDLNLGKMEIDSLDLSIRVTAGNWAFRRPSRLKLGPGSEFTLEGSFSRNNILNVSLSTRNNRLDVLFQHLGIPHVRGMGNLKLNVSGAVSNPSVAAEFDLDSLSYQHVKFLQVAGRGNIRQIFKDRSGTFVLKIPAGNYDKLDLQKGLLVLHLNRNQLFLDTLRVYNRENLVFIQGRVEKKQDSLLFAINRFLGIYQDYYFQNGDVLAGKLIDDSLHIDNFLVQTAGGGSVELSGHLNFKGNSKLKAQLRKVNLLPLNPFVHFPYRIQGLVQADLFFQGNFKAPRLSLDLQAENLSLDAHLLGNLDMALSFRDYRLEISRFRYSRGPTSNLSLRGAVDLAAAEDSIGWKPHPQSSVELEMEFNQLLLQDYAFLIKTNLPVEGMLSGSTKISGKLGAPNGNFRFGGTQLRYGDYMFPEVRINGNITPDQVQVVAGVVNFANTEIHVSGFRKMNWDVEHPAGILADTYFELHADIEEDSLNFLGTINPEVDRITGDIKLQSTLSGTFKNLAVSQTRIDIRNGVLYLYKLENPIENLQLSAHQEGSRLVIDELRAWSKKSAIRQSFIKRAIAFMFYPVTKLIGGKKREGEISGEGTVDLQYLARPKFNLSFSLNRVYFNYFIENTRVVVSSSNLTVTGRDTITVAGKVQVQEGEVEIDYSESEKNVYLSSSVRLIPPFLQYLLDVEIVGGFYVRSEAPFNTFDIQLVGDTRIIQEPRSELEIYGYLEIIQGKYFVQVEEFDVQAGKIEFINPKELPEINLYAQKRKFGLIFDLSVRGRLNNPTKEIKIYDASTNQELFYPDVKDQMALLMFGVTFQELSSQAKSVFLEKGQEVLTQAVISQIEKEARHFTGLDQLRIEQQEMPLEFKEQRLYESTQAQFLALGKYVTPNLYLEYRTRLAGTGVSSIGNIPAPQLSWEPGNQIYLEYRVSRNWSISTLYQKTLLGYDKVKFDVSWKLNF